jgi:hypothetical protein
MLARPQSQQDEERITRCPITDAGPVRVTHELTDAAA